MGHQRALHLGLLILLGCLGCGCGGKGGLATESVNGEDTLASCGLLDADALAQIGVKVSVCTGGKALLPGLDTLTMLPKGPIVQARADGLCCFVEAETCPEVLACMRLDASAPCEFNGSGGGGGFPDTDLTCTTDSAYQACVALPNGQKLTGYGDCALGQTMSAHLEYYPGFDRNLGYRGTLHAISSQCRDGLGCDWPYASQAQCDAAPERCGPWGEALFTCEESLRCDDFGLECSTPFEPIDGPMCTTGQTADYFVSGSEPPGEDAFWPHAQIHCDGQKAFRTSDVYGDGSRAAVTGAGFGTDCGWWGDSARCFGSLEAMQQAMMAELSPEEMMALMPQESSPYGDKYVVTVSQGTDDELEFGAGGCLQWPPTCFGPNLRCEGDTLTMCVNGRDLSWRCGDFLGASCEIVEDTAEFETYARCTSQAWPP
jgi:hypothetical protein